MTKRNKFSRGKSESKAKRNAFEKEKAVKQHTNKVHEACAPIEGKTAGQRELIKAIGRSTVVFITGCAGSGKTYISTGLAADDLVQGNIDKIICTRPIVSCGGDLGILPGTADEKLAPYMAPLVDILNRRIGKSAVECFIKNKQIQHIPLQLMRGASFDNAVILADEMENSTAEQLEMLLTRIGENTTLIINGDIRQKDISNSGLQYAINKVSHIDGIEHVEMTVDDIVRSGIVKEIVKAFWGD
tara:strand:- start:3413 stop:4144 length:732 start_codon:yes stop_codon:yes gene_type:complete